jgi:hypothetical protein
MRCDIRRHCSAVATYSGLALESTHGRNVLNLVLATGYLRRLLENVSVVRFFEQTSLGNFGRVSKLVESSSLDAAA